MARPGVTYAQVAAAATTLHTQHEEPTIDRVRALIGTGSKSTLAPLLKRWRAENALPEHAAPTLPRDLLEAVKALQDRIHQAADQRISEAQEIFQTEYTTLKTECQALQTTLTQTTREQHILEQQLQTLTQDHQTTQATLLDTQNQLQKTQWQQETLRTQLQNAQTSMAELKQEKTAMRAHFEHYQTHIAADRHQEREQFRATQQQLQMQIQTLREQLTRAEAGITGLREDRHQQEIQVQALTQERTALLNAVGQKESALAQLQASLDAALIEQRRQQTQLEQHSQVMTQLTEQKTHAEKIVILLTQAWQITAAELGAAQDQLKQCLEQRQQDLRKKAN